MTMFMVLSYRASFCRAVPCISVAYAVMRCLSVRPSVCHVRGFCLNIVNFFAIGSHTIRVFVFPYQTAWQYSDGNRSNGGIAYRWARQKSRFWANIWFHRVL